MTVSLRIVIDRSLSLHLAPVRMKCHQLHWNKRIDFAVVHLLYLQYIWKGISPVNGGGDGPADQQGSKVISGHDVIRTANQGKNVTDMLPHVSVCLILTCFFVSTLFLSNFMVLTFHGCPYE